MAIKKKDITKELKKYSLTEAGELRYKEHSGQVGLIVNCIHNPEMSCDVGCPWFGLVRIENKEDISYMAELRCLTKSAIIPCDACDYISYREARGVE